MKRGEVWWVDFTPQSTEIQKITPVIVVSNDLFNKATQYVQVIPTLPHRALEPSVIGVIVIINGIKHKALINQITTIHKSRLKTKMAELCEEEMLAIRRAIRRYLGL